MHIKRLALLFIFVTLILGEGYEELSYEKV